MPSKARPRRSHAFAHVLSMASAALASFKLVLKRSMQ